MATAEERLATLRAIPDEDLESRSIFERWADSEQSLANATPPDSADWFSTEQAAAEPEVLESRAGDEPTPPVV